MKEEIYTRTKYKNSKIVKKRFALQNVFAKNYKCVVCGKIARGMRKCQPLCYDHYNQDFVKKEEKE